VVVIEPRVAPLREGYDLGAESVREPPGRPVPAIAMREALRPVPLECPPEPAHLPEGVSPIPSAACAVVICPRCEQAENAEAAALLWGQVYLAFSSSVRERTESLTR